jgi:hypothetical protein
MTPDSWIVGVEYEDGNYAILQSGSGLGGDPSRVVSVHIPISFPWEDQPQIRDVGLQAVAGYEEDMGTETQYSARLEDTVPNAEQTWEMEVEIWEYPPGAFNYAELTHSDQIRNAEYDPDDLLSLIS